MHSDSFLLRLLNTLASPHVLKTSKPSLLLTSILHAHYTRLKLLLLLFVCARARPTISAYKMTLGINSSLSAAGDCTFAKALVNRRLQKTKPVLPPLCVPDNIHELSRNDPPSPPANPPPSPRRRPSIEYSLSHTPFGDGDSQEMWENRNELVSSNP